MYSHDSPLLYHARTACNLADSLHDTCIHAAEPSFLVPCCGLSSGCADSLSYVRTLSLSLRTLCVRTLPLFPLSLVCTVHMWSVRAVSRVCRATKARGGGMLACVHMRQACERAKRRRRVARGVCIGDDACACLRARGGCGGGCLAEARDASRVAWRGVSGALCPLLALAPTLLQQGVCVHLWCHACVY